MASIPIDPVLLRSSRQELGQVSGDDEWEYEYDEHQTDTFYLTLDLTTTSTPSKKRKRKGRKTSAPDNDEASSDDESSDSLQEEQVDPEEDEIQEERPVEPIPQGSAAAGRVQILDLHTMNPLVMYHDRIYNCRWESQIGTELLFTQPTSENELPALRSTPEYNLLAASSFRLTAQSAQLAPRKKPRIGGSLFMDSTMEAPSRSHDGQIPMGPDSLPSRRRQARFLEELMETKVEQGETDEVTVHIINPLNQARWRTHLAKQKDKRSPEQQPVTLDDDDSASDDDASSETTSQEDFDPAEQDMYDQ